MKPKIKPKFKKVLYMTAAQREWVAAQAIEREITQNAVICELMNRQIEMESTFRAKNNKG